VVLVATGNGEAKENLGLRSYLCVSHEVDDAWCLIMIWDEILRSELLQSRLQS
jgi:hypothetical protein